MYFSHQWHHGGSNDNPTAKQVPFSAATLVQQQSMYRDIKTMNIEGEDRTTSGIEAMSKPYQNVLEHNMSIKGEDRTTSGIEAMSKPLPKHNVSVKG